MNTRPLIALDAMGGDFGPPVTVAGALIAASQGIDLILVGDEASIQAELRDWPVGVLRPRVLHSGANVPMDQPGSRAYRAKDTSLRLSAQLVQSGQAEAMVSMGNTGAVLATALSILGPLPGVDRPALGVTLPNTSPEGFLLLDAGANTEVRPEQLLQFAKLGSAFMRAASHIERPRVGLLSIGEEPRKGTTTVRRAHEMLAGAPDVNFIGNVEARDMMFGTADVVVTDGFTGNVVVKLIEGLSQFLFGAFDRTTDGHRAFIGEEVRALRDALTADTRGAVPLLGVCGNVFVGHGRSTPAGVASAMRTALATVQGATLREFMSGLANDSLSTETCRDESACAQE
jgi:phosphate acyltransferase